MTTKLGAEMSLFAIEHARSETGDLNAIRDSEFNGLRQLIYEATGIVLSDSKREMLCSRLAKRLRHFGYSTYADYYDHLLHRDQDGGERSQLINCITTNKTDFFREPHHFDFLRNNVFPRLLAHAAEGGPKRLRIWSAGCSTGEEPYTIAMTILEHFGPPPGWDVRILASDIDSDVLAKAEYGVYSSDRIQEIPLQYRSKFLTAGRGPDDGKYKVVPRLREMIAFRRVNFMDDAWPIRTTFDVIFCRNVVIYFDRPTQQRLFERMEKFLSEDGNLILGHSENLYGVTDRFKPLGNTVYQRAVGTSADRVARQPAATPPRSGPVGAKTKESIIVAGDVFASKMPACVSTLLGSCIAACLYDPNAGIGGMNHFMLPTGVGSDNDSARYGINAMELLINEIMKHGGDRRRLQAKVFGGAKVIDIEGATLNVGLRNAEFVRNFLSTESIPIVSEYLGGTSGLKVRFQTHTGRAFVKAFDGRELVEVARDEQNRSQAIAKNISDPACDITLF
jgi:chemotaxis protein methyltransferase CheR